MVFFYDGAIMVKCMVAEIFCETEDSLLLLIIQIFDVSKKQNIHRCMIFKYNKN